MSQERNNYFESFEQEEQRSIEFTEYPELHRYYSSRMKSENKPTKIILTEIYSPSQKQTKINNYFNQAKSYKNINKDKDEVYSYYKRKECNVDNSSRNENSSSQVNIKRRVYSNILENNDINHDGNNYSENFKYYERKNIKEKSNPRYESITRVIGYGNLIPIQNQHQTVTQNQKMVQNYSLVDLNKNTFDKYKRSQNTQSSQNKDKNYLMPTSIKKVEIAQKNYLMSKSNKKVETTQKNYLMSKSNKKSEHNSIQKKETVAKNQQGQNVKKEFKKPAQLDNNKKAQITKKIEINKKQEIKINTQKNSNDYKQYERKKKEEVKKDNSQIKKYNTQIKKYETQNKQYSVNKSKEKKEIKEPIIIKRKEMIKQEFTLHSGRYTYKDNISNDIIQQRKNYNENSKEKNLKRVNIVQSNSQSKSKSKDKNKTTTANKIITTNKISSINKATTTNKTNITNKYNIANKTNTSNKINPANKSNITNKSNIPSKANVTNKINITNKTNITNKPNSINKTNINNMYKKEEKTKNLNMNITNKINISANMSNYKRKGNEQNKVQNVKSINKSNVIASNKSYANLKTESYKKVDMNKYKRGNKNNDEKIDIKEMNKIFETKIKDVKKRDNTPKVKKINFGDNYRFYERKYLLDPDDSCFTVHHLRSQKVIFEGEDYNMDEKAIINSYKSKPFVRENRYDNQFNYQTYGNNYNYENEDYYIGQEGGYYY